MMKITSSFLLPTLVALLVTSLSLSAQPRLVEYTPERISEGGELNQGDTTSITTRDDKIYMAWVVGDQVHVGIRDKDGDMESIIIHEALQQNKFHVMPAIAVDRDGYIHVTADTHHQPWVYYISKEPYSVKGGFKRYEQGDDRCPPGKSVTYPEFSYDQNDELYVAFRQQISNERPAPTGCEKGNIAGALARYDTKEKEWTMIGGDDADGYPDGAGDEAPTLFWAPEGSQFGWYQNPRVRVFFDKTNRMHVCATLGVIEVPANGWRSSTHLLYAYSDDGGETFHKANGELIESLPLTPDNADIAVDRTAEVDIWAGARIGAFAPDKPVLSYIAGGERLAIVWTGDEWEPLDVPNVANGVYARSNGDAVFFRPHSGLYFTDDKGKTFTFIPHSKPYSSTHESVDIYYFDKTGNFRFKALDASDFGIQLHEYVLDD